MQIRFWVVLFLAGSLSLSTVSVGGADTIFLKERPEGNRGVVVEESEDYVLIRFPRSEIQRIRRGALPDKEGQARSPEGPVGAVEGRVLYQGRGLAGCRVKLIRQLEATTFLEMFKEARTGSDFETVTGEDGFYRFGEVPPGGYLVRWLPPGSDAWIRRLSDKRYDVIVEEGKTATPRDIDVSGPLLDR